MSLPVCWFLWPGHTRAGVVVRRSWGRAPCFTVPKQLCLSGTPVRPPRVSCSRPPESSASPSQHCPLPPQTLLAPHGALHSPRLSPGLCTLTPRTLPLPCFGTLFCPLPPRLCLVSHPGDFPVWSPTRGLPCKCRLLPQTHGSLYSLLIPNLDSAQPSTGPQCCPAQAPAGLPPTPRAPAPPPPL